MSAGKLHADDTPVPVLAPGTGKTKTGRLWTYVRDDRASGDTTAPAVWFAYSPDRKGEHPKQHLKLYNGALQADAYSGFHHLYEGGKIYVIAKFSRKSDTAAAIRYALSRWRALTRYADDGAPEIPYMEQTPLLTFRGGAWRALSVVVVNRARKPNSH